MVIGCMSLGRLVKNLTVSSVNSDLETQSNLTVSAYYGVGTLSVMNNQKSPSGNGSESLALNAFGK